jgi:alcohol dehydrogenase YqhD (iron-dependent ADH family)
MIAHGQATQRLPSRALPIVTVLTPAATGLETNNGEVVTDEEHRCEVVRPNRLLLSARSADRP